jgi:hypothetical protein
LTLIEYQDLMNLRDAKDYPGAYDYLKGIVDKNIPFAQTNEEAIDLQTLRNWFGRASDINADDGTVSSEFVRGATEGIGESLEKPITNEKFQDVSDRLSFSA